MSLWLLFLLVPLAFSRTAYESFRLPKLLLSELLGLASLLLLALRLRAVERVGWRAFFRQPVVQAVLPMLAVASVGLVASDYPLHVREALASLWIGSACLVGWSLALSAEEHFRLLRGLIVPAALLSILAILQFLGWFVPFEFERNVGERIGLTSLAGGAFDLATYLVLPCLFLQASLRQASAKWRWPLILAAGVCGYALVVTQTLTALLAFAAGSLMLWWAWLPRRRFVAAAAVIALVGLGLGLGFGPLRQRLERKLDSLLRGDVNQVLTGRLDGWRAALWMVRQEPLTGVGHGAYRAQFGVAKEALWHEGVRFYKSQHRVYFTNAHSDVLEALAEWGVPAAFVLLWGGFLWIRCLRRVRERERADDDDDSGLGDPSQLMAAGTAVLIILALTNFPFRIALVAFPAILFISWIFAAAREASR